ncbi:MAG TPA: F0F1 ATP synthase subunit alpha, partial [Armatimonadota bacterium]|nr:F0F1 ATP synthase subunit alpha [Armatimonadota bacterium]
MALRPSEVTAVLRREIEQYQAQFDVAGVGTVLQVSDGVARIHGLADAMAGELLEFPGDVFGMALNLEEDNVAAVLLGSDVGIREGAEVKTTGRIVEVPVGKELLGRVVDALGRP